MGKIIALEDYFYNITPSISYVDSSTNESDYILSVTDNLDYTDEIRTFYLSIQWIKLTKTGNGLLYNNACSSHGFEWKILNEYGNKVTFESKRVGDLLVNILATICIDLDIGEFTYDDENINSITIERGELETITSNYRIHMVKRQDDRMDFTVMQITERVL